VTALYATFQGWPTVVPAWVVIGGIAATMVVGAVAGLYPALRAANVAPSDALAAA
jgi:putative ABC transport system permease protein